MQNVTFRPFVPPAVGKPNFNEAAREDTLEGPPPLRPPLLFVLPSSNHTRGGGKVHRGSNAQQRLVPTGTGSAAFVPFNPIAPLEYRASLFLKPFNRVEVEGERW